MEVLRRHERLFAYDDWANRETLAAIVEPGPPPPRSLKLLAHIAGTKRLWLGRLRRESKPAAVWPDLDPAGCRAALDEVARLWREYLAALIPAGLDEAGGYQRR